MSAMGKTDLTHSQLSSTKRCALFASKNPPFIPVPEGREMKGGLLQ